MKIALQAATRQWYSFSLVVTTRTWHTLCGQPAFLPPVQCVCLYMQCNECKWVHFEAISSVSRILKYISHRVQCKCIPLSGRHWNVPFKCIQTRRKSIQPFNALKANYSRCDNLMCQFADQSECWIRIPVMVLIAISVDNCHTPLSAFDRLLS